MPLELGSLIGPDARLLLAGVLGLLLIATPLTLLLRWRAQGEGAKRTLENVWQRVVAWWAIVGLIGLALFLGVHGALLLFGLLSLLGLREFSRVLELKAVDRRVLLWAAFAIVPLQYGLLAIEWPGLFFILIPVYGFVFFAARAVIADDTEHFLPRTAALHWGVIACVYSLSHLPALLTLDLPEGVEPAATLLWLIVVVQLGDACQYLWGKSLGKSRLAPNTSPNKTWAGAIGGIGTAGLLGAALSWAGPFGPLASGALALLCSTLGLLGDLTLSAVKRDAGLKDFSDALPGHGGVLDRVDSLVLSAPIYFHLVRYFASV